MGVFLSLDDDSWLELKTEAEFSKFFDGIIEKSKKVVPDLEFLGDFDISLTLSNDEFIKELNSTYMGKDKPTNVLSFPLFEKKDLDDVFNCENIKNILLGDIVLSYNTILREAEVFKRSFEDHLAHLFVHGVLHLLGYDHESLDEDAKLMEQLEINILEKVGISNPYV